ncbi:MAG TPA: hypothetical protein PKD54_14150 [Pirellulaceae bacterium]|nr:hypothetical protein [Pirellulaceae bacterium]
MANSFIILTMQKNGLARQRAKPLPGVDLPPWEANRLAALFSDSCNERLHRLINGFNFRIATKTISVVSVPALAEIRL